MTKNWVINVSTSKKKRIFFRKQAERSQLKFEFFKAVTPNKLNNFDYNSNPNQQRNYFARPLMDTEIACALSHISLWKNLLEDNSTEHYCIFEDDTYLAKDLVEIINHEKLKNIDFLKFSGLKKTPFKKITSINSKYDLHLLAYGPLDAAAYRISKSAARILIPFCMKMYYPIDIMLDRSYDHGIDIHTINPYPCKTDWHFDPSDPLFTDIGLRKFKYEKSRTFFSKLITRFNRVRTSFKKRIAHLKLIFKKY